MAVCSVSGVDFTSLLTKFQVSISDLDVDSTRNANGTLMRNRVAVKRKISLEFAPLTQSQIQSVLTAVSSKFVSVTYMDPQSGSTTKTMYTSDRTAPCVDMTSVAKGLWIGLSFNLIEQ